MDKCHGVFHDLTIAEIGFFSLSHLDEKEFADKAFIGNPHFFTPTKGKNLPLRIDLQF